MAEVYQTKKRGNHFYTKCDCCGLNQGTGASRQQEIWDKATITPGLTIVKPSNVTEKSEPVTEKPALEAAKPSEPEPKKASEAKADFDPSEPEKPSEPEPERAGSSLNGKLIAGAVFIIAAGLGAWMT